MHTQATDVEPKFSTVGVQISPKPIHPSLTDLHKPSLFSGFLTFTHTIENSGDIHEGARWIVMKCMVNANQVASRASDHGVPLLQRSSGTPFGGSDSGIADLLAAKNSRVVLIRELHCAVIFSSLLQNIPYNQPSIGPSEYQGVRVTPE